MSRSLFYSNPQLYHLLMRALYGAHFEARYRAVAADVPAGASVVDVCAGDCRLYRAFLRGRVSSYLGLDLSGPMVDWVRRQGVEARVHDLRREPVPAADVVILQGSLCQFLPDAAPIIDKLLAAARLKLIISEPVRNLSSSRHRVIAWLAQRLTDPGGGGYEGLRFNEASLLALFRSFPEFQGARPIDGGRDFVGVFRGRAGEASPGRNSA